MKLNRMLYTCLLLSQTGLADQITLKNGDRLSGGILKNDGKNLTIKSEFAGVVTIPWEAVTAVLAAGPLHIGLKDGQTLVGSVNTMEENRTLEITTRATGKVTAGKESVQFMRSAEEQAAHEKEIDRYRNLRLVDLWAGNLDIGFATSQGNAKTSSFNLSGNANRGTSRDKIAVYYTSLFASSNASGKNITTANAQARRDLLQSESRHEVVCVRIGGFGLGPVSKPGSPVRPRRRIRLSRGEDGRNRSRCAIGRRRKARVLRDWPQPHVGGSALRTGLTQKFSKSTSLQQKLVFYPDISDRGSYRLNFDMSLVTAIKKWLS